MTQFLKQAFKEANSLENRALLSHLKRTYMSKRQVGKCEAIYRAIPSMHLQGSNIGTIFVQSGYPKNHTKFLRKVQKNEESTDQIIDNVDSDENEGNIFSFVFSVYAFISFYKLKCGLTPSYFIALV